MTDLGDFRVPQGAIEAAVLAALLTGCAAQETAPVPAQLDAGAGMNDVPVEDAMVTDVDAGISVDVIVEPEPELVPEPAIVPPPAEYDRADVVWIQGRLQDLGYYEGAVDGSAGKATRKAIRAYQNDQGIETDGRPTAELRQFMWRNGG